VSGGKKDGKRLAGVNKFYVILASLTFNEKDIRPDKETCRRTSTRSAEGSHAMGEEKKRRLRKPRKTPQKKIRRSGRVRKGHICSGRRLTKLRRDAQGSSRLGEERDDLRGNKES